MTFVAGHPPAPGAGRPAGVPNKITRLLLKGARDILASDPNRNPLAAAHRITSVLEGMTQRKLTNLQDAAGNLETKDFKMIVDALATTAQLHIALAEFVYPKFRRVEHFGDVPAVNVQNKVVVALNLGTPANGPAGGPATIEHELTNGRGGGNGSAG